MTNRITHYLADWPEPSGQPSPPTRSGSSFALMTVEADARAHGANGAIGGSLTVRLECDLSNGDTYLRLESGDVIHDDGHHGCDVTVVLKHPDALHALVAALLELMANPTGADMLAAIVPRQRPEPPEPSDDDDDDDGEEWKAGATA